MKTKKLLLAATIQSILFTVTAATAGDVEVHLPAASDAMTVDQPAGTELMRVNGDGNVGIGTTTPGSILELNSTNPKLSITDSDSTKGADGHNQAIQFKDGNGETTAKVGFGTVNQILYFQNGNSGGSIRFSADELTGVSSAADMTIDTGGNVGIGTTSPATKLEIRGESDALVTLRDGDSVLHQGGHSAALDIRDGSGDRTAYLGFGTGAEGISYNNYNDDGGHHFSTAAATNRFVVHASGNVGVKISTPTADLDVNGNIRVRDAGLDCDATAAGQIRYEASLKKHQGCDGTSWNNLY